MDLTNSQKDALIRCYGNDLAEAIIGVMLENSFVGLYGDDFDIDIRVNDVERIARENERIVKEDILPTLERLTANVNDLENENIKNRLHDLENVIKPDETDVHNINRRIELLSQRIAELESKKRGWLR